MQGQAKNLPAVNQMNHIRFPLQVTRGTFCQVVGDPYSGSQQMAFVVCNYCTMRAKAYLPIFF